MGFDEWREGEAVKAQVASPVEPKIDVLGRSEFHGNFVVFPCKKTAEQAWNTWIFGKSRPFWRPAQRFGAPRVPQVLAEEAGEPCGRGGGLPVGLALRPGKGGTPWRRFQA